MKKETKQTIMMLLIVLFCLFADSIWKKVFGQVFIGPGIANKGAMIQIGILSNKTEISASYCVPFTKNTNARITALQIGQKFDITQWDSDNYSLMPYAGYGYLKWQDFTDYENDPSGKSAIVNMESFKPVIGLQFGKNSHAGNVYMFWQYCKTFYYGMGLKVYFSRL